VGRADFRAVGFACDRRRGQRANYDSRLRRSILGLGCLSLAGAQRLLGATNYPGGETRREHDSVLSLEAAGIRAGTTLHLLLRVHGGVINPPAATEASLPLPLPAENGEASAASQKIRDPLRRVGSL